MKTWKRFDYSEKVKFCEKHKKTFDEKVRVRVGRFKGIRPSKLTKLLDESRNCLDCKWETLFGR